MGKKQLFKIKRIKDAVANNKTLIQNFSYLSILRVFSLILPLVTYPYLIRTLGKETYGLVVFAQALVGYLVILVGFGFNISATKEVSIYRDNKEKLSEIVSSVLIIKSLLFVLAFIILEILLAFIPLAHDHKTLFLLSMWACLYDVIFPVWYFQGIEKMKYITYITLISRVTFLGLIFILIHSPTDYLFLPMINGIGALLAGVTSLYIIFGRQQVKFKMQSFSKLKYYFNDAIPIFISTVSIKLYVSTNKVIVGAFLGMTEVAYYDLAEKLTSVLKIPQGILSQSVFPKISKEKNIVFIRKIFKMSVIVNVVLFLFMLIFSKYIILILGGKQMLPAKIVADILALTVPIIAMSNIFTMQILIPFNYEKKVIHVVVKSFLAYLAGVGILLVTNLFTIINLSILIVLVEIFVTSLSFYYCKKLKIL